MKALQLGLAGLMAGVLTNCTSHEKTIEIGQNIHHDDFEYTVIALEKVSEIKNDSAVIVAKGIFYIVSFKVENRAIRVDHPWDNAIAYITGNDNKYENSIEAQKLLNQAAPFDWQPEYLTLHGESQVVRLVFDIPKNITKPYLMVRGESLMGDMLDGHQFDHTRIKLF